MTRRLEQGRTSARHCAAVAGVTGQTKRGGSLLPLEMVRFR